MLTMEIVLNEKFDCHGIDIILKFKFKKHIEDFWTWIIKCSK